ncbi:MAG: thioredoxin family protein [Candidatus Helarchaeota archaeon]
MDTTIKGEPELLVHIEFFKARDCPYCPTVKKMLLELLESDLGKYLIIEEIDIHTSIGRERMKPYKLKGVPSIAMNGTLKFAGIPHPILFRNEVRRLIKKTQPKKADSASSKPSFTKHSNFSKRDNGEISFYT